VQIGILPGVLLRGRLKASFVGRREEQWLRKPHAGKVVASPVVEQGHGCLALRALSRAALGVLRFVAVFMAWLRVARMQPCSSARAGIREFFRWRRG